MYSKHLALSYKEGRRALELALGFVACVLIAPPVSAAPQPLINYFQPMPIVGKLSTTVWGASTVGPRDPSNGLEDSGTDGGVGPQKETYFYWDGKILYGSDRKYHLYASHWLHSIGFGPPAGGSTGWGQSIPMEAVSDNVMGPYVSQGNCYAKNAQGNDLGHNVTALVLPTGASPYTLSVGEIVPGQMFGSSSPNGPWTLLGNTQSTANGHYGCGDTSSNFTFALGPDNRFWATSRGGCVMDSNQVLGTYKIETDSVLPNLENNDNGNAEDECIWYSGGYYHIVYNYWNVQRAYHIMSKDGITHWTSTGLAYQATQSPTNSHSNWLRYTDGTVNSWNNMERVGVVLKNGHPTHFTFAVTDLKKNVTGINQGGSKILVVPFNGVQFDCDNGDQASCAELVASGGGGGAGGMAGAGGSFGAGGGGVAGLNGSGGSPSSGGDGVAGLDSGNGGSPGGGVAGLDSSNGGSLNSNGGVAGLGSSSGGVGGNGAVPNDVAGAPGNVSGNGTAGHDGTANNPSGCQCQAGVGAPNSHTPWLVILGAIADTLRRSRRKQRTLRVMTPSKQLAE